MNAEKKRKRRYAAAAALLTAGIAAAAVLLGAFEVKEVTVEGNARYTEEEIEALVIGEGYANTLLLMAKSRSGGFGNIPFVSELEIEAVSNSHIRVRVYEKTIVGCVEYMGTYLYFDKDGMVVESSDEELSGVPRITGLKFSEVTLYEKLPVKNDDVFRVILNLTQSLDKNGIAPDRIYISERMEITLSFGEAKVLFGTEEFLDEKIANLASVVEDVRGRKGTLHMENFSEDTGNIVFEGEDG